VNEPTTLEQIIKECDEDSLAWFPQLADNLFFQAACAAGEAGEMLNEAKKAFRSVDSNTESQRKKIEEESIDVLIYLCCVWGILGTNVQEVYSAKRAANVKRFGGSTTGSESRVR
jgi:NTP pyrophosphatase (non-canonical NTP hydrolase)